MIEKGSLTLWSQNVLWRDEAQVEQDLILSRALVELFRQPLIQETCTLRGGTALNKLVFKPAARYSEDIDLVQEIPGPIGSLLDAVRACIDPWLGKPKVEVQKRGTTLVWRFETSTMPVRKSRLKLEINTREHSWVGKPIRVNYKMDNPWFCGEAEVATVALHDLLATKLRALYQRRKGRDLFDLYQALILFPSLEVREMLHGFHKVMELEGHPLTWRELEINMTTKLENALFAADIPPLLVSGEFDPKGAWEVLAPRLMNEWPGQGNG
jgi:predicted nucleotidyltransferase component of viral defense system